MATNIPNELLASVYQAGALIYGGELDVSSTTQTAIERAFEVYRRQIEEATRSTTTTTSPTTSRPTGTMLTTEEAKQRVLNLITAEPGLTKSAIIERLAGEMVATRVGVVLRTCYNNGWITCPDPARGPYFPAARSVTSANANTTETTTRQMQAAPPTGDEI